MRVLMQQRAYEGKYRCDATAARKKHVFVVIIWFSGEDKKTGGANGLEHFADLGLVNQLT